jgi:type II secretory pathway component PulM
MQKMKIKMPFDMQKVRAVVAPVEQAIGKALEYVMRLSPRERLIVAGGAVFVALFILIAGIIGPLVHAKASLEKSIISKDAQLKKIYVMSANIRGIESVSKGDASSRNKQFTLFGYLEELSTQLGINDRIEYMKPISDVTEANHESVEVKMRGLFQEDLIGLLFGIENNPYPLKIKRLSLKRVDKDGNLDVTFLVISYG